MGNITMKKILIASLVASAFVPVTFATPALALDGDDSLCSSPNRNIVWQTETYGGDDIEEVGEPTRSGGSGNVFVQVTVKSGPTYQDCNATNVKSGNPVPGQSETGILVDAGGEVIDEYSVRVCAQGTGPGTTSVTSDGIAMGFSQAQCEALTA
jgi:hypothetical protein